MSDEAGFLKAIADQPAERSTRLVYADWLDENGRPREAEFLRLQIQAAESNARLIELGGQLDAKWLTGVGNVRVVPERITLRTGRSVQLIDWQHWNFGSMYAEATPTSRENREFVERLVAEERRRRGQEPYLIEPRERVVQNAEITRDDEPRGLLPSVACIGRFDSSRPARDKSRHASQLTIIWFQHEWAFPIDPGVREQIRAIDWEQHAHDFDW